MQIAESPVGFRDISYWHEAKESLLWMLEGVL